MRQRIKERFGKRHHLQVETLEEFQGRVLAYSEEGMRYLDLFVLIGLIIATLGVPNPAWRVAWLDVVEAIRHE